MLLRDLHDLHGRLVDEGRMMPDGFRRAPVQIVVDLSPTGEVRSVVAPKDERGRPLERIIPDLPRTSAVGSLLIADKLGYVVGLAPPGRRERASAQRGAYRSLLEELMNATTSTRLADRVRAVWTATEDPAAFADRLVGPDVPLDRRGWLPPDADMSDADIKLQLDQAQWLVDFTVDYETFFPSITGDHGGDPDCVSWWSERVASVSTSNRVGLCQVTNQRAPLARLFPGVGELPGTASKLVSCNFPSAERYGASQSDGAAVSTAVASRATSALKWLAGAERASHRWDLDELAAVWWCPNDLSWNPLQVLREPDPQVVRDLLSTSLWRGRPTLDERSRFHVAVLTVNSARIVVRADHAIMLDLLQRRLRGWFEGIQHVRDRAPNARLGIGDLAAAACAPGRSHAPQRTRVALDLLRRALLGEALPRSLRDQAVRRCDVGTVDLRGRRVHVTAAQAALLHAFSHTWEENPLPGSQGELCGRLLAILELTQQRALGSELNRGVDASYGAASTTPHLVFPRLFTRRVAHAKRLRRDGSKGTLVYLDRLMEDVMARLIEAGGFPTHLAPAAKAEFALGYWHQRHDMHRPAESPPSADQVAGHESHAGDDRDNGDIDD